MAETGATGSSATSPPENRDDVTMSSSNVLAVDFEDAAAPVDPSRVSVSKWKPVSRAVAEALGLDEDDVYTVTVSKAGNLSVRAEQSQKAGARVLVVMWTGPSANDFDATVSSARRHCRARDVVLIARKAGVRTDGQPRWTVEVVLDAQGSPPAAVAAAWPGATALAY